MVRVHRVTLIAAVASALTLWGEAAASASTVTVGSPLTGSYAPTLVGEQATVANVFLDEPGARATSPVAGVIVRWRVVGASGGPFKLRVVTPTGGGAFTGTGTSAPETPASTSVQTFTTNLPISAGDLIGIDNANSSDKTGIDYSNSGSTRDTWAPPLQDDAAGTAPSNPSPQHGEEGFNADVVPQPTVSSMSPTSGPETGGTQVLIQGHDLSGATAVDFGGHPASSFTVDSDNQITAVSPAHLFFEPPGNPEEVTVTTPGGTASAGLFRYEYTFGCAVQKLKGLTLVQARQRLGTPRCKLGIRVVAKPRHAKGKKLVVKSQSPLPGTVLAGGGRVWVKLGLKQHHKKH